MAPFAKTGGLADVAGSLPQALGRLGIDVLVLMPKYRGITDTEKSLGEHVRVRFVEHEGFFNRSGLYGNADGDYPDNLDRFSFFSRECLRLARELGFKPDVVHAHDWHAAIVPVLLKAKPDPFFQKTKSVLTIHNLAYQGHFDYAQWPKLGLPASLFSVDGFEFYGKINVLKAGLLYADRLNAVSPAYAKEIQAAEAGCALEGVLQKRQKDLSGILNGIDTALWDPWADKKLAAPFSAAAPAGKKVCKAALQKQCGLAEDPETPVFAIVSRLAEQKGLDILAEVAPAMLSKKLQLVLLGDGDARYRQAFAALEKRFPKAMKAHIGFDAAAAHAIYAGADFFLMPSLFEPCGLGQMISMRYGTLPVVRATGGLKDTVKDGVNGFVFERPSSAEFLAAVECALKTYGDKTTLKKMTETAMNADFSWEESAKKYEALYREAAGS